MGFFSKVWKKVKKGFKGAFKNIGNAVKKVFKGFGKFMNKIGIVGQLAMSFILPGIGGALMKTAGKAFTGITKALGASGNLIAKGAGKMLEMGGNFAKMGHSAFKTVTEGIGSFVTEMGGAVLGNIPGVKNLFPKITDKKFSTAWNNVQSKFNANVEKFSSAFDDLIGNTAPMNTATQANVLAQNKAVTGTGTTPGSTAEIKGFELPETLGPDGNPLLTKEPFYPTPDGKLPVDKPFLPTPTGEMPSVLDAAGLETVGPDGFALDRKPFYPTPTGELAAVSATPAASKSLLDKGIDFVKKTGTEIKDSVVDSVKNAPETIGDFAGEKAEAAIVSKVVGEEEYEAPETFVSRGAAAYQQVDVGQYNSPEMNDRAYQMAVNPEVYGMQNPFGYTAQDSYQQQMLQFTRPQYG